MGANSVTLAQAAQIEKQPLRKGIMMGLAQESVILDMMSWRKTGSLSETGVRYDEVPEPSWTALGGSISSVKANGKPLNFGIYQLLAHIDIPRLLEEQDADMIMRQSEVQSKLALKGAAYKVNDTFINGNQAADPNQPEGLNKLVAMMDSGQTIGSTEIDLTAAYSDTIAESFFSLIDQMISAINGSSPTAAFANKQLLLKMRSWGRQYNIRGNDFDWVKNPYDVGDIRTSFGTAATRPAFMYAGVPFYDIGKKADQTTNVIASNYAEGGSASATRIFMTKVGEDDLEGLMAEKPDIRKIGPLEGTDEDRWRLSGALGIAAWSPWCIVKGQGIKIA